MSVGIFLGCDPMSERRGNMKCIFDRYFVDGHECDRDFQCEGCPTREDIKRIVQELVVEELTGESDGRSDRNITALP